MSQDELIQKTIELIAIESRSDNIPALHEVVDFFIKILQPHKDITVERFESNGIPSLLAYYGKHRPAKFDVLLSGHADAVPGKPSQYKAHVKGNRLYGRGVYDMKMACLIMADAFITAGNNPHRKIGLQITTDEEVGGTNGVAYQIQQGVNSRFTIFGEMTDLGICNEMRGLTWIEVGFKGLNAHGGYAWNGVNAVTKASDFAQAVLKMFPLPKQQEWRTTANIAAITTGNTAFNMVPDEAKVRIDFRYIPEDPIFKNRSTIEAFVKSIDPTAELLDLPSYALPIFVDPNHPELRYLTQVYEAKVGKRATLIKRYGSGDGRYFAEIGEASVEFGLGGDDLHGENEYVDLDTVAPYRAVLQAFLTNAVTPAKKQVRVADTVVVEA